MTLVVHHFLWSVYYITICVNSHLEVRCLQGVLYESTVVLHILQAQLEIISHQPDAWVYSIPHPYLCTMYILYYTQCITCVYRHLAKLKKVKVCCTISRTDTHLNTFRKIRPRQRLTNLASSWCYHCAAYSAHLQYAASGLPIRHLPLWVVDSIKPILYSLHRTFTVLIVLSLISWLSWPQVSSPFILQTGESWWQERLGMRLCMYRILIT